MTNPQEAASVASRRGQTLVKGHTLRQEGSPHAVNESGQVVRVWEGRYGRALCSCGWLSDLVDSNAARQRLHRWHKTTKQAEASPQTAPSSRGTGVLSPGGDGRNAPTVRPPLGAQDAQAGARPVERP